MSFRRPTHVDETFTNYGVTYFIGHGANENHSMSIPWHQVRAILHWINEPSRANELSRIQIHHAENL